MATKMHSYTLSSVKGGTYELHQLHCTVIQHSTHYCALAGGGKGTCEPSQLTTVYKYKYKYKLIYIYNTILLSSDRGGKGTGEPSQLTLAKTQTQHWAHPLNDDHDDDHDHHDDEHDV